MRSSKLTAPSSSGRRSPAKRQLYSPPVIPGSAPPPLTERDAADPDSWWWGPLAALRPDVGRTLPPPGQPFRVAFVGQRTYFELCSQRTQSPVIEPILVEHRSGRDSRQLVAALHAARPHAVVVFRPELVEQGCLDRLDALTVGVLTEPLPRTGDTHPDLQRRLHDLAAVVPEQFDRIVSFDPEIAPTAARYLDVWRAVPLPVADEVYGWPEPSLRPRLVFVGRSTPHRERFLLALKHQYDLLHVDHGLFGDDFVAATRPPGQIALNLHNEPYPTFENRVSLHLAAGHLVLSEPLSPTHGLEPGIDFVEVRDPEETMAIVGRIITDPLRFEWVRWRGRLKAEGFRASRVWARILHDLLLDVAAFGGR